MPREEFPLPRPGGVGILCTLADRVDAELMTPPVPPCRVSTSRSA